MKIFVAAALVASLAFTGAAEARGCLKGAAVGGIAGHYWHHHAVLGAIAGCAIGHHMAVKKEREDKARQQEIQRAHAQHAI